MWKRTVWNRSVAFLLSVSAAFAGGAKSGQDANSGNDLTRISLEELMNIEISSVSRKEQKLSRTSAAAFVVTQEDIRRSGAASIPEALRMVPGLQVARIDSNKWAISARGFNGRFANKMLVLVDGRSVYNNLYSGVYWDQLDLMLEDIEQIEVIRGPGATMWGANAVNGVINIITRKASQTQGTLLSAGSGNEDQAVTALRHGGSIGKAVHYRAYSKYLRRGSLPNSAGEPAGDNWGTQRGGGRLDWEASPSDSLSVHGDMYHGGANETVHTNFPMVESSPHLRSRIDFSGGYLQTRWNHKISDRSEVDLQWYYAEDRRAEAFGVGRFGVMDLDFQHRAGTGGRHDLIWGLGYRRLHDRIDPGLTTSFDPPQRSDNLCSSFLQDDITLIADRLVLTLGSKFLHNSYSGFEVQPSLHLAYTPSSRSMLWGALSRAVRTPSRRDHDLALEFSLPAQAGLPTFGRMLGNRDFESEVVVAHEAGYRRQVARRVAVDIAAFYNGHSRLQSALTGVPVLEMSPGPRLVVPVEYGNDVEGGSYGGELATTWSLSQNWTINANYTWLQMSLRRLKAEAMILPQADAGRNPRHQVQLRSLLDLRPGVSIDVAAFYVSRLPALQIPGYLRLDTHLGWRLTKHVEMSVGARNLLDNKHVEFISEDYVQNAEIGRTGYLKMTWRF